MNVYFGVDELPENFKGSVISLGVFDGLHLAHLEIINRVVERAVEEKTHSMIVSFYPHPQRVLSNRKYSDLPILTTIDEKKELLESNKLDASLFLKADRKFLGVTAEDFIKDVLVDQIRVKEVIVGYDYHFGKDRLGSPALLKEQGEYFGFHTELIPPFRIENVVVSSSLIRKLLLEGNIKESNKLIGRSYSFKGHVVLGSGRGKTIGFPTANIKLNDPEKLIPKGGVYLTKVKIEEVSVFGMCNIGVRPTFNESEVVIEIHLLSGNEQNLYCKEVEVRFLERVRDEVRFSSFELLKRQIDLDRSHCIEKIKECYT